MTFSKDYYELAEDAIKALEEGDLAFYEECIEEMRGCESARFVE